MFKVFFQSFLVWLRVGLALCAAIKYSDSLNTRMAEFLLMFSRTGGSYHPPTGGGIERLLAAPICIFVHKGKKR